MSLDLLFILQGRTPVPEPDVLKWAEWYHNADRQVAVTHFSDGAGVSTVFLGVESAMGGRLLFETMVFNGPLAGLRDWCQTWEEAEAMHERMVGQMRTVLLKQRGIDDEGTFGEDQGEGPQG